MTLKPTPEAGDQADDFDRLHGDICRFFPELVRSLGADPATLLRAAGMPPEDLEVLPTRIGYRAWARLLELAAETLECPDFGLRLAMRQGGVKVFGPMGEVMRNSRNLLAALDYVSAHAHAHSLASVVRLEWSGDGRSLFVGHEILVEQLPITRQVVEQLMLLGHLNALESTGRRARYREVRFRHQPLSPLSTYYRYFGCDVRFDQQEDGAVYCRGDLLAPIINVDIRAYEEAVAHIAAKIPAAQPPLRALVRGATLQMLGALPCNNETVAERLGLHPRTLHRRLSAEMTSFQQIKDDVRRDVALYYVKHTDFDFAYIAHKIGYSEHSVLTRSCARWFSASPSELRSLRTVRPTHARAA